MRETFKKALLSLLDFEDRFQNSVVGRYEKLNRAFVAFLVRVSQDFRHFSLMSQNSLCYTIPTLVDRISTVAHSLRCVLSSPVERCERISNERSLVLHIEDLSFSAPVFLLSIHIF